MPRKKSHLTVTDQFCGAGGNSQGVRRLARKNGGGIEVRMAMNHWKLAIETHNTNFPDTDHDCADVSASDPRRYPSTDILITSPECTTHSPAGGNTHRQLKRQMDMFNSGKIDPATERSRATMWDVCRFAEYHRYNAIIVENVVEAKTRWPLFDSWLSAMGVLGYNHKLCFLNSMHFHPTPQSRDRMYIVFWKKGNKAPNLEHQPLAYCPLCAANIYSIQTWKPGRRHGKYKTQYVYSCPVHGKPVEPYYYASFNCIDWTDIGKRIGDRKNPLSPNTRKRVEYGLEKYGNQPFQVQIANGLNHAIRSKPLTDPSFAHTTWPSQAFVINDQHSTGVDFRVNGMFDRLPVVSTQPHFKLIHPFIVNTENPNASGEMTRSVSGAMRTQTTRQTAALVTPWIVEMNSSGECKPADHATSTITTGGSNHALLSAPLIVANYTPGYTKPATAAMPAVRTKDSTGLITSESWNAFIAQYYGGSDCTKNLTEEIGSVTTRDRSALVSYQTPNIEDCYYRMLKPPEIKLAMAFDREYIVLGNAKDQVKQCGNAVTPPAMEWIVERVVESLK